MENKQNSSTFIFHYRDVPQWLQQSPYAFHLLSGFARRARRTSGNVGWQGENIHLETRQFITGRLTVSRDLGLTEGQYREAYKKLEKNGLIKTIRTTNRYTIGMYCTDNVFNINPDEELPSKEPSKQPTPHQQTTTNNNGNNEKNVKSRLEKLQTYKNNYPITNPKSFSPSTEGETAALEAWNKLEPFNPFAFQTTYLWAYKKGLPPALFYQFTSKIQQDKFVENAGKVFRKKVKDYLKIK